MQIIAVPFDSFLPRDSVERTPADRRAAREAAREVIDQAAKEVTSGKDFGKVARKYSRGVRAPRGGVWPMMEAGSFRESEVERNAFRLKAEQVCGIIETKTGYYIVKALKVEPGREIDFEQAQPEIERILREQQYQKLSEEYFKKLISGATIEPAEKFMELAIERAVERHWNE